MGYLVRDVDWLAEPPEGDPFRGIVAFPEAEVLITAFSAVAATMTADVDEVDLLTGASALVEKQQSTMRGRGSGQPDGPFFCARSRQGSDAIGRRELIWRSA